MLVRWAFCTAEWLIVALRSFERASGNVAQYRLGKFNNRSFVQPQQPIGGRHNRAGFLGLRRAALGQHQDHHFA